MIRFGLRFLLLVLALTAAAPQARASDQFDDMWLDRVSAPIWLVKLEKMSAPAPTRTVSVAIATPIDEAQHAEDVAKRERGSSCMTLRQARAKWPTTYLSWHGDHCWTTGERRRRR
jgi:hypothetical protein